MKKLIVTITLLLGLCTAAVSVLAADYIMDTKKAHSSITFKISHLGFSWMPGRFNRFDGRFSYDEKDPSAAQVVVTIDPASVDTNHAERDKHLRSEDFLHVDRFPEAKFVSTGFQEQSGGKALLKGDLTLHGVTRPITIDVEHTGHGADPWGGYRRGFYGTTSLRLKDYGITFDLGPASETMELFLSVEGIRQ